MLATSGTPVAISRMVSMAYAQGRKREADKIFRVSFLLFSVIGMAGCLVMVVFARQFSILMTQGDRSMYAIAALAPMVLFMSLSSCLRGYFQGRSNMTPTAVSQVLESVVKLFVGIALALYLLKTTACRSLGAAAIIGVSVGSLFAVLYILVYYFKSAPKRAIWCARCPFQHEEHPARHCRFRGAGHRRLHVSEPFWTLWIPA